MVVAAGPVVPAGPADIPQWARREQLRVPVNGISSGVLYTGRGSLTLASLGFLGASGAASVVIYDGTSANGDVMGAVSGTQPYSQSIASGEGIPFERGLYLLITGGAPFGVLVFFITPEDYGQDLS